MRVTEINSMIKSVEYAGEIFVNLQELNELLKMNFKIEMGDCLITPYYIQDNRRMELYQYEFCCTNELEFQQYILKLTGKEKIEDVSKEIYILRRNCFSTCDEPNGLANFLKFLFENKNLKKEIKQVFGDYIPENLYAAIY